MMNLKGLEKACSQLDTFKEELDAEFSALKNDIANLNKYAVKLNKGGRNVKPPKFSMLPTVQLPNGTIVPGNDNSELASATFKVPRPVKKATKGKKKKETVSPDSSESEELPEKLSTNQKEDLQLRVVRSTRVTRGRKNTAQPEIEETSKPKTRGRKKKLQPDDSDEDTFTVNQSVKHLEPEVDGERVKEDFTISKPKRGRPKITKPTESSDNGQTETFPSSKGKGKGKKATQPKDDDSLNLDNKKKASGSSKGKSQGQSTPNQIEDKSSTWEDLEKPSGSSKGRKGKKPKKTKDSKPSSDEDIFNPVEIQETTKGKEEEKTIQPRDPLIEKSTNKTVIICKADAVKAEKASQSAESDELPAETDELKLIKNSTNKTIIICKADAVKAEKASQSAESDELPAENVEPPIENDQLPSETDEPSKKKKRSSSLSVISDKENKKRKFFGETEDCSTATEKTSSDAGSSRRTRSKTRETNNSGKRKYESLSASPGNRKKAQKHSNIAQNLKSGMLIPKSISVLKPKPPLSAKKVNSAVKNREAEYAEQRKRKEEALKKKLKEEEVLKKKEELMKSRQEQLRKKNEDKVQVAMQREALEKEKREEMERLEREKEEKERLLREEAERAKEAKLHSKKMLNIQKAQEAEERRQKEEAARLAKLKQQEEEHKRQEELRNRQQEQAERLQQQRKLEEERRKVAELKLQQGKRNAAEVPGVDKDDYGLDDDIDSDVEDVPKKAIPSWARTQERLKAVKCQQCIPEELKSDYFAMPNKSPALKTFFGKNAIIRARTSSAVWTTPKSNQSEE